MIDNKSVAHFEALYPAESYFNEINQILRFVKSGDSCQLIGLPGVGRSNLLGLLSYNRNVRIKHIGQDNQTKFHFVHLNFGEIRKKPLVDATKFLFLGLVDSLRERKKLKEYKEATKIFNEALSSGDELVIFQGLKKTVDYFCLEKGLTIIFLFDRFEEYLPMLTQEFFTNLNSLRNRAKYKFSVVFSSNRPLEEILEPLIISEFYEFLEGNIVYMPLTDKPSLEFRTDYLEKINGNKLPKKITDKTVGLTAGHGKLTRLSLEAYLSVDKVEGDLEEFLLSKNRVKNVLSEIWNFLTPSEQQLVESGIFDNAPFFLENVGLIKEGKITIPLFDKYLRAMDKNMIDQIENTQIVFDSEKNEIKKGELIISERLTSAEFRLLKFLLQNPDTVLGRDLIITAVWGDLASTQGVTDQAVDQLIFRLRKKLEEDPINPTHIQTIKGRGIKFIP